MAWHEAVVAVTITLEKKVAWKNIAIKAFAILSLLLKESNKHTG
jgi:hypothetical protein